MTLKSDDSQSDNIVVQTRQHISGALKWAIEQARKELVDPSRRNRLLHAPLSGKRPWCMAVEGASADDIFDSLQREENFRGYAFAPTPTAETDLLAPIDAVSRSPGGIATGQDVGPPVDPAIPRTKAGRRPQLQTRLDTQKLEKRLTKIFREDRTLEEEQGVSTLYLAVGFLRWFESDQSEEASYAPLILLPVSLSRVRGKEGFLLTGRDDEIVINVSLSEKLKNEFSVSLPAIPEGDEWQPSDYFDTVEEAIHRYRWVVERQSIGLGFFTFSKFMMWRDLDAANWPNDGLLAHPLLNVLIGDGGEFETTAPLVPDDEQIDQTIDISKAIHVVDADSSQALVIEEAATGRNLVVQGPPGTGKSQTITNIIAAAVHSGKTVLFVAEKTAALAVVQDRLNRAGLGALCLSIHSKKANKREVLKTLDEALRFGVSQQPDSDVAEQLASCRDKLNGWSHALHKRINNTGRTCYEVIGAQLKLRADNVQLLPIQLNEVSDWTKQEISQALVALDRACDAIRKIGCAPSAHAWFGTNLQTLSPFDIVRLTTTLGQAVEKFDLLHSRLSSIYEKIVGPGEPSFMDATGLVIAFRHLALAPAGRTVLENNLWSQQAEIVGKAIANGEQVSSLVRDVNACFQSEAWTFDTSALLHSLRADGPSFFRRLGKRYRQAKADFRAICRAQPPKSLPQRIEMVEKLRSGQTAYAEFSKSKGALLSLLGPLWEDINTDWTKARDLANWVRVAQQQIGTPQIMALAAKSADVSTFGTYASSLDEAVQAAQEAFATVRATVQPDPNIYSTEYFDSASLTELRRLVATWSENIDAANDWIAVRSSLEHLRAEGFGQLVDGLIEGEFDAAQVRSQTELLIAEALWKRATQNDPELANIDGLVRTAHIDDFRTFDHRRIRAARHEVISRYITQKPNGFAGEMGIIRGEIEKKRGHRALRKLMDDAGSAVQRLKPVFLMSPLSVAQFLKPGKLQFDLLVIDEASQVSPEDALGAVARAKQIVVVGDHRQLPPTNFFKTVNAGSEDQDEDGETEVTTIQTRPGDYESILTLARTRGMSERMLAWHYRSKHPSLIALSNDECYGGRLLLPPSPFVQTEDFGLSLVKTPRGHYDRGGTSRDLVQAEEVAKAVREHIRNFPNKSLGIACLSVQQREAVYDMIDKLGIRADVEAFAPKDERLFVKNLEAVQGDERDVIFISVGYGVAPNQSRPFLNFGPVSRDGGERRLNVLASRTREKCIVYSSLTAADIPADSEVRGTRMLRSLLHFAETGKLGAGSFEGGDFDSPFEEAVARVIREAGFRVHSQVGVSSFRIDLGVINPVRPGEYIVGVECDGATYHGARSARDRDRIRQEVLEGLGWRLHRVWSTDWFRNPTRETDKLLAAIRQAEQSRSTMRVDADDEGDDELQPVTEVPAPLPVNDEEALVDGLTSETHYKECAIAVPFRRGMLELSVAELSRLSLSVVEAEGPVHTEEVARRLREAFGLQKTGNRILKHVKDSLSYLNRSGLVARDGDFWIIRGSDSLVVRSRRNAPLPLRRATMIAPSEYQLAISTVIDEAVSISPDELAVETARRFGFDRTGQDLKQEIDRQVKTLMRAGKIVLDGEVIRTSPSLH
jgi:very-short-patch-repair endonuclease